MRSRLTHHALPIALIPPFLYSFSPLAPPRQDGEGAGGVRLRVEAGNDNKLQRMPVRSVSRLLASSSNLPLGDSLARRMRALPVIACLSQRSDNRASEY